MARWRHPRRGGRCPRVAQRDEARDHQPTARGVAGERDGAGRLAGVEERGVHRDEVFDRRGERGARGARGSRR